jgi:predicted Zn-dependent protease with MMP-like domain
MTPAQFMEFTILHELAHSFGLDHNDVTAGTTTDFYNQAIWASCFQ